MPSQLPALTSHHLGGTLGEGKSSVAGRSVSPSRAIHGAPRRSPTRSIAPPRQTQPTTLSDVLSHSLVQTQATTQPLAKQNHALMTRPMTQAEHKPLPSRALASRQQSGHYRRSLPLPKSQSTLPPPPLFVGSSDAQPQSITFKPPKSRRGYTRSRATRRNHRRSQTLPAGFTLPLPAVTTTAIIRPASTNPDSQSSTYSRPEFNQGSLPPSRATQTSETTYFQALDTKGTSLDRPWDADATSSRVMPAPYESGQSERPQRDSVDQGADQDIGVDVLNQQMQEGVAESGSKQRRASNITIVTGGVRHGRLSLGNVRVNEDGTAVRQSAIPRIPQARHSVAYIPTLLQPGNQVEFTLAEESASTQFDMAISGNGGLGHPKLASTFQPPSPTKPLTSQAQQAGSRRTSQALGGQPTPSQSLQPLHSPGHHVVLPQVSKQSAQPHADTLDFASAFQVLPATSITE
eukprot:m.6580 g.6580  ORF g.6580 m.6580 type:complete len:462 (-) comp5175_c0_seq1:246-1631(-)